MMVIEELSICTDCAMVAANGECGERPEGLPEPWALIDGPTQVEYVVGDVTDDFATSPCEACGDYLAGERWSCSRLG